MKKIRLVQMETVGGEKVYFIDLYRNLLTGWKTVEYPVWMKYKELDTTTSREYLNCETDKEIALIQYKEILDILRRRNSTYRDEEAKRKKNKIRKNSMKVVKEDII